jgi:hypothetical protein
MIKASHQNFDFTFGIGTLTISHFKEAPLPKNNTLAKWGAS